MEIPNGIQIGSGAKVSAISKVFTEGVLENTDNVLDIAIEGDGFFQILMPSGDFRYSRDGSFRLNSNGQLVTADGFLLQPPVAIPNDFTEITIGTDGTVSVATAGNPGQSQVIGNITTTRFPNVGGLRSEGRNFFSQTTASGAPIQGTPGQNGLGTIQQGFLERSNVSVVQELIKLITAQRGFETNQRAIRTSDDMLETSNQIIR